jgi:hypothetical protein
MSDPRHGTVAGYNRIPCREDCCKLAMARYKKRWAWDQMQGRARIVSTLGTRRRIRALNALGWSSATIARRAGMPDTNMTRLLHRSDTMTAALAARFESIYEELAMTLPTGSAQAIAATRNRARRNGWPPPLAWDNIDDPDEQPDTGWRPVHNRPAAELLAEWAHLRGLGVSEHRAAQQLGVSVEAIEKAMERGRAA